MGPRTLVTPLSSCMSWSKRDISHRPENPTLFTRTARKNKSNTVLTLNAENQPEAETESPWQPKSVLAFLDCLEAIKYALILIELGPEKDNRFFVGQASAGTR